MTATIDDLDRLKEAYRVWSASGGDECDPWLALMSDDFEYGTLEDGAPGLEFSKHRRGKEAMMEGFQQLKRDWRMICHVADEFLRDGDRIVVLIRTTWQHRDSGKIVDSPAAHVWRYKDGKAISKFEFTDSSAWQRAAQPSPD